MNLAYGMQKFQDWFTQQWVILWGRKINPNEYLWLIGPFGELNGIGEDFIFQLASKENLTADYDLKLNVNWNPLFKVFGYLVNRLFSQRINQLNIPTENIKESESLISEIIELISNENKELKYTIWLRKFKSTGKVIYSGIYTTCTLPSNTTCIKAIFPLPKGNATVILKPSVGDKNELILDSSGVHFGDAGFYFLLNDAKGNYWSQYIKSFTDKLIVSEENKNLVARQNLKLWNLKVANFEYRIKNKLHTTAVLQKLG